MPNNAADRKSIREAEKRSARYERDRQEFLANAMSTVAGRAYLWSQLESAHIFASSFSTDPLRMAFLEGERNAGLLLLTDLMRWCPDQFIQAMREANGRRTESDTRGADDSGPGPEHDGGEDANGRIEGRLGPTVDDTGEVHYN